MKLVLASLVLMSALGLKAEGILPENIQQGKQIPSRISPDRKFAMFEVFHSETTQTSVIVATLDRTLNLGRIPVPTEWSTDQPYKGRTVILWSPDSTLVAVHDSLAKHSAVSVHRLTPQALEKVPLPPLLDQACATLKVDRASLRSSSQIPEAWLDDGGLRVKIELRCKDGTRRFTRAEVPCR